jgi:hypothetical protein
MFSFFKRNKSSSQTKGSNNNSNNNNESSKTSVNIQNAIERQQASLQQMLDVRRQSNKNEVNDRDENVGNLHSSNIEESLKNRSSVLVNEISNKTNILKASDTCAPPRTQNYDQFRDAKRRSNPFFTENIEYAPRQSLTTSYSPTVAHVASSINVERCSTTITTGTSSTKNEYNSVYEVMGRGRNRNKHTRGGNNSTSLNGNGQNSNSRHVKNQTIVTNLNSVQNNSNDIDDNNSCQSVKVNGLEQQKNKQQQQNNNADNVEYSEKSASISLCENVFHDENSCSINSQTLEERNRQDNITTSDADADDDDDDVDDEEEIQNQVFATTSTSTSSATMRSDEEKNEKKSDMKNDENCGSDGENQQVNSSAPLQRSLSSKRVTFAPATDTRMLASSESDDDNESDNDETLSEDIFYEAADVPTDTSQKLKILSTITSHSSDVMMSRIDEESSEMNNEQRGNDVVSASMILSLDGNEPSDEIAFNGISNHEKEATPKTMKPSYSMLGGDDPIALPDIVAETSPQHHNNNNNTNGNNKENEM